jgi:hypothetical protein
VERQTVLGKPLRQYLGDAQCVQFASKDDDSIICVANQNRTPTQPRRDLLDEPRIQHLVQ